MDSWIPPDVIRLRGAPMDHGPEAWTFARNENFPLTSKRSILETAAPLLTMDRYF